MIDLNISVLAGQAIIKASTRAYAELYVFCTRRDNPETLYIVLHAVPHDSRTPYPVGQWRPITELELRQSIPDSVQRVNLDVYRSDLPFDRLLARTRWQRENAPALAQSA